MKTLTIYLLTVLTFITALRAQQPGDITNATDFEQLEKDFSALDSLLKKKEIEYEDVAEMEIRLSSQINHIYLDINTRMPKGLGNITPNWEAYISKLGNAIEPYESEIIEASYRTISDDLPQGYQLKRIGTYLIDFLDFAKPDEELHAKLRASLDQFPKARWQIYRKLHELRLLTEADVEQMVALGETITDPQEKIRWAEEISFYGSDAGLDVLEEIISKPFDPTGPVDNESYLSYVPVMRSIRYLGTRAERLLPFIRERKNEVFNSYKKRFGPDIASAGIRLFNSMENSIETGRIPYLSARNGSGILYPPGYQPQDSQKTQCESKPTSDLVLGKQGKVPNSASEGKFSVLKNHSLWLGLLGLVIFLITAAWAVKRKKSA
jgi:hypothetical protein